jgi:hypothetical protein
VDTSDQADADFLEAIRGLENHRKGTGSYRHTLEKTLNRLFRKNLTGNPDIASHPPRLSSKNVRVTKVKQPKQGFAHLAPDGAARHSDGPILIVKYRGVCCLIDGNHRVRAWRKDPEKHSDSHMAYLLVVEETKSA